MTKLPPDESEGRELVAGNPFIIKLVRFSTYTLVSIYILSSLIIVK